MQLCAFTPNHNINQKKVQLLCKIKKSDLILSLSLANEENFLFQNNKGARGPKIQATTIIIFDPHGITIYSMYDDYNGCQIINFRETADFVPS